MVPLHSKVPGATPCPNYLLRMNAITPSCRLTYAFLPAFEAFRSSERLGGNAVEVFEKVFVLVLGGRASESELGVESPRR